MTACRGTWYFGTFQVDVVSCEVACGATVDKLIIIFNHKKK
jgi:hypothetical protein